MPFIRKKFSFQNLQLSYLDSETESANPVILIAHANGYSAGCYSYIMRRYSDQFRVIGLDFAGHGESEGNLHFDNWLFFRDQIIALIHHEKLESIVGIGHSLGGASLLMASRILTEHFPKLVLFDPTILNIPLIFFGFVFGVPLAEQAKKRRRKFKSIDQVRKTFRRFISFAKWDPEIFEDYLKSCLREDGDGVELCCDPQMEAKIFETLSIFSPLRYTSIHTESHIVIPQNYNVCSPTTARNITRGNSNSSLVIMPEFTHFFPFEEKKWVLSKLDTVLFYR